MSLAADMTLIFQALPGAYLVLSPALLIEAVSDAYLAATLTTRAQLLGQYLFEAFPDNPAAPEAQAVVRLRASLQEVLATRQPHQMARQHYDVPDPHQPGHFVERYWQPVNTPVLGPDGAVRYVIHHVVDVTEQVRAEWVRAVQERLIETVFEQAPTAIWVTRGPSHIVELVNPRMARFLGRAPSELLGRPYFEVMTELVGLGLPALLQQAWEQGKPLVLEEFAAKLPYHGPDEVTHCTFVLQPLRDEAGQITRLACVVTDVSEQVHARHQVQRLNQELAALNEVLTTTNEELRESNTHLTRTNADLDTFIYTASHDLKSPITNIEGLLLALGDVLPIEVRQGELVAHLLTLLDDTVHRFRNTITQLTDLVRLQQSQQGLVEQLDLAAVLESVIHDLAPEIQAAGATVQVAIPAGLRVGFVPANLRSIVYNLLSNAVKYRAPDRATQVWVRAAPHPNTVTLSVQDNGLGLDEVQQGRLFQVFQRLHTHVEGTGVGLYMIKRLIENGGATIAVSSTPGVGTTFTATFCTQHLGVVRGKP
ncbi:PAS domain-containing sensor histidine kinase [Hymenobacter sp. BT507]|uniref:histidine kinase n=1 Tax=Hymenobacter citatus TaxID=2763506 RepID=A0ABR7MJV3_9BACT|nr:PAS domain-containing sensor histidine kinase [Hymenobacter citatus]MBC6611346.1 PAS domain-containing sensor histidine kinase [Hymenobacter citatus]